MHTHDGGEAHDPSTIVVFGADGDLTKRKLIPALYHLMVGHHLPEQFAIVGMAITPMSTEDFRAKLSKDITEHLAGPMDRAVWESFIQRVYYVTGDFLDPLAYRRLQEFLEQVSGRHQTGGNYLFYLATASQFFSEIVRQLGMRGLTAQREGKNLFYAYNTVGFFYCLPKLLQILLHPI